MFTPPTEWVMPDGYPDLSDAREIAIDLETRDPNLTTMGSGWPRKDGYVIGIAVAVEGKAWYFPIRHENGGNFDAKQSHTVTLKLPKSWHSHSGITVTDLLHIRANNQIDASGLITLTLAPRESVVYQKEN